jgi:hypothetical protein
VRLYSGFRRSPLARRCRSPPRAFRARSHPWRALFRHRHVIARQTTRCRRRTRHRAAPSDRGIPVFVILEGHVLHEGVAAPQDDKPMKTHASVTSSHIFPQKHDKIAENRVNLRAKNGLV